MGDREPGADLPQLVEDNTPDLLAYFVRRVDAPEDAADLLHDTLVVLCRNQSSIPDHPVEARMWMFGVARNVVSTHRRTNRRRTALHDKLRDDLTTATRNEGHAYDGPDVRRALSELDPLDQEVIRLHAWDGFTQAEIAVLLDMPEGTVRSRTHRARRRLRRALSTPSVR